MKDYKKFCQACATCGKLTSKKFARAHSGQCKNCSTVNPANEYGNDGYQKYNEEAAAIRYMENRGEE